MFQWMLHGRREGLNEVTIGCQAFHQLKEKEQKVVHFNSRIKRCHTCYRAAQAKKLVPTHECHVNWPGSTKEMESDMFVEMVKDSTDKGIKIAKVAGDDDNAGINQLQKYSNMDIIKESDKNHVHKNITKKLYSLAASHKSLTKKVIGSVTKNFNNMLQQNQGKPGDISVGLKAVVEHLFGNHTYCPSWCGYLKVGEKYKHANLLYGKDLYDESLHKALLEIFTRLDVNKLAFLSSTQANESLRT